MQNFALKKEEGNKHSRNGKILESLLQVVISSLLNTWELKEFVMVFLMDF